MLFVVVVLNVEWPFGIQLHLVSLPLLKTRDCMFHVVSQNSGKPRLWTRPCSD